MAQTYSGFATEFAHHIFKNKYAQGDGDTWEALANRLVDDVCGDNGRDLRTPLLGPEEISELKQIIRNRQFIPGGRYLYYAGRPLHAWNNCYLLKVEVDSREEWGRVLQRASDCLMSGGGIGIDYSVIRPSGSKLSRTGGTCSGPIPLMRSVNEVGRNVMQGGSRRSAIYGSLNWQHADAPAFVVEKNWSDDVKALKAKDFNFPATLDMTNISLNWDDAFLRLRDQGQLPAIWYDSVRQMLHTAEPGHSYNFGDKQHETLRNACAEVTSADDSDVCNLGSINLAAIDDLATFERVVHLASRFLVCGTVRADLPYQKVYDVRAKNRRLGLGLMGLHEWLLKRNQRYHVSPELHQWLAVYRDQSEISAKDLCDRLSLSRPVAFRSIAPTGSIGIMASTTTGVEPLFATAYKRRYLTNGKDWKYEYVVDATARKIIEETGIDPDSIETAYSLARDPEKRVAFQADVQDYVDMAISATINLPSWGSSLNNEDTVKPFAEMLSRYAHRLRGFTAYPDGARGGQPLTEVPYREAISQQGVVFDEVEEKCVGGICGL